MQIPKYLEKKENIIIYNNQEITNKSIFKNTGNKFSLNKDGKVYIYLDNSDIKKDFEITIKKNRHIELFLIYNNSKTTEINMSFNLEQEANLKLISGFVAKRRTKLTAVRNFNIASDAKLELLNALLFKGNLDLSDYVNLNGLNAEVDLDLLNIGSKTDEFKVRQDVLHNAKQTKSNILNSLISNNKSRLSYSVSGRIFKGNELSTCSQLNKGIILQEEGYILAEPKLFIDEYNVEANHGAAIGQIDDEQLFYLLSRGLSEIEARSLIISGYTTPFINKINDETIKKQFSRLANRKIKEANS